MRRQRMRELPPTGEVAETVGKYVLSRDPRPEPFLGLVATIVKAF